MIVTPENQIEINKSSLPDATTNHNKKQERLKLKYSLLFPVFFVALIWFIQLCEQAFQLNFTQMGIFPLHKKGLWGILLSPLIHADFKHLISNTTPLFLLGWGLFYFYRPVAYQVFILCYFTTNILLWLAAREAYHIGASGLVYAFASFLFFSGIVRKHYRLIAISLSVVFLYGGLFWGLFPIVNHISWEGHLYGVISGLVYALLFRNKSLKNHDKFSLDDDPESIPEEIWNADKYKYEL